MNNSKTLIDIIVPVYNGASYIENFARMMSPQKNEKVRFLFVDDGSKDDTLERLNGLSESFPFDMKVISRENGGVGAARNSGISEADAKYLAFFDIDDRCSEDYISLLASIAGGEDFDVLIFNRVMMYDEKESFPEGEDSAPRPVDRLDILRGILYDSDRFGFANTLLIRREFLLEKELLYKERLPYYEEIEFMYRCLGCAEKILHLNKSIYGYIAKRQGSIMSKFKPGKLSYLYLFENLQPYFDEKLPEFAEEFRRYCISRLYWSALWQAALVSTDKKTFTDFADRTHAEVYMKLLKGYPEKKVKALRLLYLLSANLYYFVVRSLGGKYTLLQKASGADFEEDISKCPDPRKVLVYGMSDNHGGIESYFMELFRFEKRNIFDFVCDYKDIAYKDELLLGGSKIHFIPAKGRHPFAHLSKISRILKEHPEYTSMYLNILDAACIYSAIPAYLKGRKVAVHSHTTDTAHKTAHRLCRPILNLISRAKVACSKEASDYMFGRGAREVLLVPNFIDAKKFSYDEKLRLETRLEHGISDRFVICSIGRLTPQKNPLFQIDILKEVLKLSEDACLLHVGGGEMDKEFNEYCRQLGLEENVINLGEQTDVAKYLQAADVFLFPSVYEGLGIALIEAQASGLYCVISDRIPASADITDLVQRLSLSEPASAWAKALTKHALYERKDMYETIAHSGYDISCCSEAYSRLVKRLLD